MHEVSVMSGVVEAVLKELEKYDVKGVEEVELIVGELTQLGHEQMEFAYEVITRSTALEGSSLRIVEEKAEVRCLSCGYEGGINRLELDDYHYSIPVLRCPECSSSVEIIKGRGCTVRSLKVIQ
ncbi:MAG: hydrogenase nickel incorporation protein HypA/HybF [Candidatus Methanomethylophilaceae archaeon]|nr:hydrogenase nickel incorporation protein HypA/HybF [Candidatus Methanomethylophilaceae archaeon]MDI3542008.1 hydrogenase nickel incorporation protein HypA/HybF [Candidatus Methanomethylophilaceae archaeon]